MKNKKIILKLISLFLSITLWFYVVSSKPVTISKKILLQFEIPDKYAISNDTPSKIQMFLKGPRLFLNELNEGTIVKVKIDSDDLKKSKKNKIKYIFSKNDIILPLGVKVVKTNPKFIDLSFSKKIRKWLIPKLVISDIDRKKYSIKKINFNYKKVLVQGPFETLKNKTKMNFGDVNFDFIESNTWFEPDSVEQKQISLVEEKLKVNIDFGPSGSNKTFKKLKIYYFSADNKFTSNTTYADIEVFQSKLNKIFTNKDIKIYTDIPENAKGSLTLELKARIPEGIHLVRIIPRKIKVNFK